MNNFYELFLEAWQLALKKSMQKMNQLTFGIFWSSLVIRISKNADCINVLLLLLWQVTFSKEIIRCCKTNIVHCYKTPLLINPSKSNTEVY